MSSSGKRRNVSNWSYVAIAYGVVWGALALYALLLARRVAQARTMADRLHETVQEDRRPGEEDSPVCDAPPAP